MRLVDREGLQRYLCDVSRSSVWRYMRQGMPFIQAVKGSPYMYDLDAVDAWLKRDQTPPTEQPPPEESRQRGHSGSSKGKGGAHLLTRALAALQ